MRSTSRPEQALRSSGKKRRHCGNCAEPATAGLQLVPAYNSFPNHQPPTTNHNACRGITLIELMLVLLLLVAIGSLTIPLVEGSFATLRLRRATDRVVAVWVRARVAAIESGQVHQFLFRTESGDYRVEPWPTDKEAIEPILGNRSERQSSTYEFYPDDGTAILQGKLPESIEFYRGQQVHDPTSDDSQWEQSVEDLTQAREKEWSQPILFFPDGTSSTVSLMLRNQRQQYQRATLRGLTGTSRTSGILTESDTKP